MKSAHRLRLLIFTTLSTWGADMIVEFSALTNSNANIFFFPDITPQALLCIEMMAIRKEVDVISGFLIDGEYALTQYHNVSFLEEYFSLPIVSATRDIFYIFQTKDQFAAWMRRNSLSTYVPNDYKSPDNVIYPCVVKAASLAGGKGIFVVNNRAELDKAVSAQQGKYLLEEAITGSTEPSVHFMARNGKMLALMCSISKLPPANYSLFVKEGDAILDQSEIRHAVHCDDLNHITKLYASLKAILSRSRYNGFGCINAKFAANKMTAHELDAYMQALPAAEGDENMTTDFGPEGESYDATESLAIIKYFDFNPRMCGTMLYHAKNQVLPMIRLYMGAM